MKRQWFEFDDGTFYRNCPLIKDEEERAVRRGRFKLAARLSDEWRETFRRGVQRKDQLGRGDVSLGRVRQSFRELLPGLVGRIPESEIDWMDALPNLPGDPKFRWSWR